MFRRLAIVATLASIVAAFVLPGTAAAADPYHVIVKINHCQYTGGAHGRGYLELKVKAREVGTSGTTHFVVLSARQQSSGLAFSTVETYPEELSSTFPNDSTNYFHVTDRRYDLTKADEISNRLVITVKFKNDAGKTLATRTINGSGC
jgi:hypothetical protein